MHAKAGDWLIVESRKDDRHARRAEILAVPSKDGEPPYTVRWLDTGHETVVFPGPDARILSPEAMQEEFDHVPAWNPGPHPAH